MGRKKNSDASLSPNFAVRLDDATKKALSFVAVAVGLSEKEIAVEAIGLWIKANRDSIQRGVAKFTGSVLED